jgi:hypothetical protein
LPRAPKLTRAMRAVLGVKLHERQDAKTPGSQEEEDVNAEALRRRDRSE